MALSAPSFRNWSNQDTQRLFKQWDSIRDKNREQYQGFADNYYQNRLRYQPLLDALKPVNKRLTKIKDLTKIISQNTMSNLQRMDKGKKLDALAAFIKQLSRFGDDDGANEIESTLFGSDTNARGFFEKIYFSNNKTSSTNDPEEYRKLMEMIDDEQIDAVISLALSNEDYMEPLEDIINQTAEYERDFERTQEPPYDYLGDINLPEESQPPTQYGSIPPYQPPPPYSPPPSYRDVVSPPPPYSLPPSYSGISPPPSYSDITPPPSYSSLYPPRVPPPYREPRVDPRVPPPYPADIPAFELPRSWGSLVPSTPSTAYGSPNPLYSPPFSSLAPSTELGSPDIQYQGPYGSLVPSTEYGSPNLPYQPPSTPVPESLKTNKLTSNIVAAYTFAGMRVPADVAGLMRDESVRDIIIGLIGDRLNEAALNLTDLKEIEKVRLLDYMMLDLVGGNKRRFNVINRFQKSALDKVVDVISMLKTTDAQLNFLIAEEGYPNDYIRIPFQVRGAKLRASGKVGVSLSITPEGRWELFGKPVSFPDPLHIKVGNNEYLIINGLMRLILSNNPEIYTNYVDDIDRNMYMRIAADAIAAHDVFKILSKAENQKLERIRSVLGSIKDAEIARETKTPTGEGYERTKKLRKQIYELEKRMEKRGLKKEQAAKAKAKKREEELSPLVDEINKIAAEAKEIKGNTKKIKKSLKIKGKKGTKKVKGKGEFSNSMTFQANTRKRDRAQATKQVNEGITFGHGMPQMSKPLKEVHPSKLKNKLVLLKGSQQAGNNGKKVQAEIKKIEGELKRRGLM